MTPTLLQLFLALSFYRKIYPVYKFSWHMIEITFKVLNLLQNSEHLILKIVEFALCSVSARYIRRFTRQYFHQFKIKKIRD